LWAIATDLLPDAPAGEPLHAAMATYTQGLMDLGATVCTIRRPACDACPAHAMCAGPRVGRAREVSRQDAQAEAQQARERAAVAAAQGSRVAGAARRFRRVGAAVVAARVRHRRRAGTRGRTLARHARMDGAVQARADALRLDAAAVEAAVARRGVDGAATRDRTAGRGERRCVDEPGEADVHGDVEPDDAAPAERPAAVSEGRWFARADLDSVGIPSPIRKLLDAALPD
jgi:adenine-specific DNA glycosylase